MRLAEVAADETVCRVSTMTRFTDGERAGRLVARFEDGDRLGDGLRFRAAGLLDGLERLGLAAARPTIIINTLASAV